MRGLDYLRSIHIGGIHHFIWLFKSCVAGFHVCKMIQICYLLLLTTNIIIIIIIIIIRRRRIYAVMVTGFVSLSYDL